MKVENYSSSTSGSDSPRGVNRSNGRRYPHHISLDFIILFCFSRLRYSRGYRDVSDWVEDLEREDDWEDQSEKERERFEKVSEMNVSYV